MTPVLIAGEINADLVLSGCAGVPQLGQEILAQDFQQVPGSSSMICAMGLAKLGRPVVFRGLAGADMWGDYCRAALLQAGIDCTGVELRPQLRTGLTVALSNQRDRALVTFSGAMDVLTVDDIADAWLQPGAHLHLASCFLQRGLLPGLPALLRRAKARGLTVSLDPGFDPSEAWQLDIGALLPWIDVFLPNHVELAALTGAASPRQGLLKLGGGNTLTVVKCGRDGALSQHRGEWYKVDAFATETRDSTGAGDSFDAGFLHAWLNRLPLAACLQWGAACGALSTRAMGGTGSQADMDEVQQLLANAAC